jgi:hypothetical protein
MQRNALTDVVILEIDGVELPGLLTKSEGGYSMEQIQVAERGYIRYISSGNKDLTEQTIEYIVKRDSPTMRFFVAWDKEQKAGGPADKSMVAWHTDKDGSILDYEYRETMTVEPRGIVTAPYDEAGRDVMKITVDYAVWDYELEPRGA